MKGGQYLFSYLQGSYVHLKSNNGYQTFGTVGGCSKTCFRVESLEFQKLKNCTLNIGLVSIVSDWFQLGWQKWPRVHLSLENPTFYAYFFQGKFWQLSPPGCCFIEFKFDIQMQYKSQNISTQFESNLKKALHKFNPMIHSIKVTWYNLIEKILCKYFFFEDS